MGRQPLPARRSLPPGLRFGWATGVGLLGVLLLGWLTALRGVLHQLLVSIGATALVPFWILLGAVALVAATSVAGALIADASSLQHSNAGGGVRGRWLRAYHTQLARQRQNPLAWGLIAGCALGVVGVWLVLTALVIPLETRTLGILSLARARLASSSPARGQATDAADSPLRPSAWDPTAGAGPDNPVLDAFGHPIARQARGAAGQFTLRSLGLDGVPSSDDLCVSAQTGVGLDAANDPLRFVEDLRADRLGWSAQFAALDGARCRAPH